MIAIAGQFALIVASIGLLLGVMGLVRMVAERFDIGPELQRKAVHIATGGYALILPVLFKEHWPVLLLIAVTLVVMLVLRSGSFARSGIGAAVHSVERRSYGDMLLAVAVGFLFVRSSGEPVLYALPILVLTLSDAAAALVGTAYGRKLFQVEAGIKSLEGVAAFFLVTCIIAMVMLLLMTDIPRVNVVLLAFAVAAFGALVEADSWRGFDNLFLPVGLHLFLVQHMDKPPLGLALLIIGVAVTLVVMMAFARPLGLTSHAARAYTVALFLICSYTEAQNAILPGLALLAHLAARATSPTRSPFPDLDSIAALAAISLLWLFFGEWFGRTAISFYTMTFAGVIAALALIAFGDRAGRTMHLAAAVILSAALAVAFHWIVGLGPEATRWHGALWLPLTATLLLASAAAILRPDIFARYRSPRVAVLAGLVPAASYLYLVAH